MMKAAVKEEQYLIFRVGLVACCVSIEAIDSIVRAQFGALHQLPNQASYISGVLQYRDKIISIVNLFHKFAQSPPVDEPGDYIIAHTRFGLAGFWVNEVLDIVDTPEDAWSEAPLYLGDNIFQKTMMWQDKLILQSEFDHLIAMNDSGRINNWAAQNRSDLFEQDAANSVFEEENLLEDSEYIASDYASIDEVVSVIEPVAEMDNRPKDTEPEPENEITLSNLISEQNIDVKLDVTESKIADVDTLFSNIEIVPNNSLTLSENDTIKIAGEDSIAVDREIIIDNSSDETIIVPGFTRFMEESSIASDFEDSSDIIELSTHQSSAHSEPVTVEKTDLVSTFSRSATEILSIHSTFDETNIQESDFVEVDSIAFDTVESDINESMIEHEMPEQAIDDTTIFDPIKKSEPIENKNNWSEDSTSYSVVEFDQHLESAFINPEHSVLKSDSDLSSVIDSYISDAEKPNVDVAVQEKREASIRKVINRIEENNPPPDRKKKVRLVASVLVAASAVFFIQHYTAEDKNLLASTHDSIELLTDNALVEMTTSSVVLIEAVAIEDTPVIFEVEGLLPILPIPLTNGVKIPIGKNTAFPWRAHVVSQGDTLWDLSAHYLKNSFRYPELARWSNIENPDFIYPGDKVKYLDEHNIEIQSYKKIVKFR